MVEVGRLNLAPSSFSVASGCLASAAWAHLPGGGQQGFTATLVRLGGQGSAPLEVLAHAPHGRHTIIQHGGNLLGALALIVEMNDSLAHSYGHRFHLQTILQLPALRSCFMEML